MTTNDPWFMVKILAMVTLAIGPEVLTVCALEDYAGHLAAPALARRMVPTGGGLRILAILFAAFVGIARL